MPEHLYKSRTNKVFAGVCGGVAEYFKADPTLIRLAWALAFFVGGTGFILYILAMIIMPDGPGAPAGKANLSNQTELPAGEQSKDQAVQPNQPVTNGRNGESKRQQILGLALVAIGGFFLLEKIFPFFHIGSWWPLILIILGVFVLFKDKGGAR